MRRLRLPVAGLIVALSPGFTAYEAFASGMKTGAGITVPAVQAVTPAGLPSIPALPGSLIPQTGFQQPLLNAPILPPVTVGAQNSQALTHLPLIAPDTLPASRGNSEIPTGALPALQQTAGQLAQQPGQERETLDQLFTGGKLQAGEIGGPSGLGTGSSASGLSVASVSDLETIAADQSKPKAERSEAVKALAAKKSVDAKAALHRVGVASASTDADDYQVKREALAALADQGTLVSMPPISRVHADQILKDLASSKKPKLAVFDYDSTLEKSGQPASKETGEALENLAKSGVETVILTDRAPLARRGGDVGMKDTLSGLTDSQKGVVTVATNRGAQLWISGMKQLANQGEKWTNNEAIAISDVALEFQRKYGLSPQASITTDYDYARFMNRGTPNATVDEAAAFFKDELAKRGVNAAATPRYASVDEPLPYITLSKFDKAHGVALVRRLGEHLARLRDVERLPKWLQGAARRLVSIFPKGQPTPAAATLLVGDHFFGPRGIDADMIKGAPGALAISVGGTADPRLENTFVWPTTGHEASMELAKAAAAPAAPAMEGLDKKAAWGLFVARSASIVAFLGTTLAHAKLSYQYLQPADFGTVAALGTLAAIIAGPLLGRVADKMSPRKGMSINTILRGVLLLDLPLFALLGVMNFWTLLLGAIANGFLLSSIMTSESAYLRRLFGFKNLGTMNSLLQLNYFALQIVFGLLLGIGKLVDGHNLMIPFYIASAVNFLVVLPIIRRTMPDTTNAQVNGTAAAAPEAKPTWGQRLAGAQAFMKKYWKEALIVAASAATFPFLHSAIPITLGVVYWITRTEGFGVIKQDKSILKAVGLVAAGAFALYSMQSYMLPTIAKVLGGASSSLLQGQMLGALFLGQMISSSSLAKLPAVRLPIIGRFGLQRLIQGAVLAMVAAWVYFSLVPGSILAVAAALTLGTAMMAGSNRLTDKGWLSFIGVGMASLALPAMWWGNPVFMLAGLVSFGFFLGPATVSLFAYIQRRAPSNQIGAIMGIQGSLFNAAISLGIGSVTLLTGLFSPAFPPAMWAMAALATAIGAIYFLVSRTMPGLADKAFHTKDKEEVKK